MGTYETLSDALVNLFHDITEIEQRSVRSLGFPDLTSNDMHVIEAIGIGEPQNMSSIAKKLSVTVGTLTIAVNSLVKKGYVIRQRSKEDRRVVLVLLSEKGQQVYEHHAKFHRDMIRSVMEALSKEELSALIRGVRKLNSWFKSFQED